MIEAFGGFVRCGNCDYKFNVHDQVQIERDYFELSSANVLDEETPVRLHTMGGIEDDEIQAPPSGRIEPALEVKDDGLNIRFSADEYEQHAPATEAPASLSTPKVEPRFEAPVEGELPVDESLTDLRIEADTDLEIEAKSIEKKASDLAPAKEESLGDELEQLLNMPDIEPSATENKAAGESLAEDDISKESQDDDFSWELDSFEAFPDDKAVPVFDHDQTEPEDLAQPERDPLDAFTFGADADEPTGDEDLPYEESRGEVHTLLNTDEEEQAADAPGFFRRFAAGLGHFMLFGFWLLLSIGLVYLLIGQVKDRVYPQFKSEPLVQDIRSRLCGFLPCSVSKYDADKYEIVVSRMDEVRDPNRQLHISVFLLNTAEQAQVYPSLRIRFNRLDGSTIGQRVIGPDEYETSSNHVAMAGDGAGSVTRPLIQPNKLGKILIRFNNPPADVVGFEAQVAP